MKLKRFLLRYYPPGVILEYELRDKTRETKEIDLLHLTPEPRALDTGPGGLEITDVDVLVNQLVFEEPLIAESRKPQLRRLVYKLIEKLESHESSDYYLFKILRAHILPLTNCAFNKQGDKFITGSYDRTCKIWQTDTGEELLTLEGHRNVVYAIAFNNPWGDKIITGSFDKTCKIWNSANGDLYHTYRGHATEIVCLSFDPRGTLVATGSMDNTARLWDAKIRRLPPETAARARRKLLVG
ncbi:WD40-repeat-containing domain protein [Pelagophyceae sp. CCMP2097]|nr:WD40-repeat-containing domain protein [Pelagophyceae sp. CCMP2097]